MRQHIPLCALAALSLAACQKVADTGAPSSRAAEVAGRMAAADSAAAPAADASAEPVAIVDVRAPALSKPGVPASVPGRSAMTPLPPVGMSIPQLAYAYKYALAAPPEAVRTLVSKHEQVCWAAGPSVCQVVGSNITENGPDQVAATLTLRAQPAWLRTFRNGLEDDTKAVGGRTVTADTSSDDLSRSIVDTEAGLRSRIILRDRLEEALRTRTAKVSELFDMEQQLAQVRGEIDATRSELAMMRTRVATSTLSIQYSSEGVLAPSGSWAPVSRAAGDVVGIFVGTLAFLIRALALLAPMVGLGAAGWWFVQKGQRRKAPVKAPAA